MPFTALAVGAALGLVKSEAIDAPKEARDRKLAAATQRYSPWTHLQAQPIKTADPFGSALQYGASGAALGQNIQNSNAMDTYLKNNPYGGAKVDFNAGASPVPGANYGLANNPWSGFGGPNPYGG